MKLLHKRDLIASFVLCATLAGCANSEKMPGKDREAISTVRLIMPEKAKPNLYDDSTSRSAGVAFTSLGVVGGIIGDSIAEVDIRSGVKRWAPVTQGSETQVLDIVRRNLEKRFTETGSLHFSTASPADALFVITDVCYGVAKASHQSFAASISIGSEIRNLSGKCIWKHIATATSDTKKTLAEYESTPEAYELALNEAADKAAIKCSQAISANPESTSEKRAKTSENWWESSR